jgi:segregation and condensation protein A
MDSNALRRQTGYEKQDFKPPEQANFEMVKTSESAIDGIEILVEMAQSGKIDPWNIDIADVTEKYLQTILEIRTNNLKLTGRTLFFAALLLRIKSDVLEGINFLDAIAEEPEFIEEEGESEGEADNINYGNVISLDEVLQRRTSVKLHKSRIVTLQDLIKQLEFYEKIDRELALKHKQKHAPSRARSYEHFTAEDIINLAHEEYIENSVTKIQAVLEKLFESDRRIELSELTATGMDKVSAYIALLFLSARSRISLVQDEFYSELYVVPEEEVQD